MIVIANPSKADTVFGCWIAASIVASPARKRRALYDLFTTIVTRARLCRSRHATV